MLQQHGLGLPIPLVLLPSSRPTCLEGDRYTRGTVADPGDPNKTSFILPPRSLAVLWKSKVLLPPWSSGLSLDDRPVTPAPYTRVSRLSL